MKPLLYVSARRAPKRDASGKEDPKEQIGVFSLDVPENTKGAFNYTGVIDGKPWSKWQKEAGVVRGRVRWVDVQKKKFGTKLYLFVENDKALYRIEFPYDTKHLKQLGNNLLGMKDQLKESFWSFHYDVWAQKNPDKTPKLNKKGTQAWMTTIKIPDAPLWKEWKELAAYLKEKGLDWEQVYNAQKDSYEFDSSKEMVFWLNVLASIQRYLLADCSDVCTPFTYDSVLATPHPHPMGVKTLTEDEVAACQNIYEAIRGSYQMPYGRTAQDADDAFFDYEQDDQLSESPTQIQLDQADAMGFANPVTAPRSALATAPTFGGGDPFPTEAPPVMEGDDLPF